METYPKGIIEQVRVIDSPTGMRGGDDTDVQELVAGVPKNEITGEHVGR